MALYLQAVLSLSLSLFVRATACFTSNIFFKRFADFRPRPRARMSTHTFSGRATCIAPDVRRRGEARRTYATRCDATRIFDFATSLEIIGVRISDPTASAVTTTPSKKYRDCILGYFQSQSFPNAFVLCQKNFVILNYCSLVFVYLLFLLQLINRKFSRRKGYSNR